MDVPDITLATAIWGAITGTAAIILSAADYWRNRPELRVHQQIEVRGGSEPSATFVLRIVHSGRQPTTVYDAGFAHQWRTERTKFFKKRRVPRTRTLEAEGADLPTRLDPGDVITFRLPIAERHRRMNHHYDGYAMDTRNKLVLAKPYISRDLQMRLIHEVFEPPTRRRESGGATG